MVGREKCSEVRHFIQVVFEELKYMLLISIHLLPTGDTFEIPEKQNKKFSDQSLELVTSI